MISMKARSLLPSLSGKGVKRMRNPLIKRIPKELISDWHKYIVIIVFMVMMIGVISGMYIGHDSMLASVYSNRDELNLEDGSFELNEKASQELLDAISAGDTADVRAYYISKGFEEADEKIAEAFGDLIDQEMYKDAVEEAYEEAHNEVIKTVDEEWEKISDRYNLDDEDFTPVPVTIYEHFYREEDEDVNADGTKDANVRIYKSDSEVDKAAFLEGHAPETSDEIAIDRMHADNMGVEVGDAIRIGNRDFTVTGLLSYVNYLTLHESNTDLMFDSFGFNVAMVTPEGFDTLSSRIHYSYAFMYDVSPADKVEKADYSERFLKVLITQTLVHDNEIEDYLPEYLRQASNFAISDIEGDSAGSAILCYILIGVIAFIFAITISTTIDRESTVIGTLRASGYSRAELVMHYMSMPLIVTIIGAVIGNALGYTAFKNIALNLYYNTYSLPSCGLVISRTALIKTTVIPFILMLCINLFVIINKLRLSPLRFLRKDLTSHKRKKAMRLPRWSFLRRFRIRIFIQNLPNYLILIFGVIFIELMLCFAFGLPDSLDNFKENSTEMMFADHQYMLMGSRDEDGNAITTSEETAERFSAVTLLYPKKKSSFRAGMGSGGDEKVTVYGIAQGSRYITLDSGVDGVYISSAFSKKFGLSAGDVITLNEEYANKSYELKVSGIVDYDGGIAVFMTPDVFNETFDMAEDDFSGYFSENEITDIDEQYIAAEITAEDVTKVSNQLEHSMGGAMEVFKYALIIMTTALIYLLAKIIIEKNEHSISMVKILGFENNEIAKLYIAPTAIVVTVFSLVSFAVGYYLMIWVFHAFMLQMDGYFGFYMSYASSIFSVLFLLLGYAFVSVIDFIRIRKIPMDIALKNVD